MALLHSEAEYSSFWEQDGKLFEYPPELCIKNGFISSRPPRTTRTSSLDELELLLERRVKSCPNSGLKDVGLETEKQAPAWPDGLDLVQDQPVQSDSAATNSCGAAASNGTSNDTFGGSWGEAEIDELGVDIGSEGLAHVPWRRPELVEVANSWCDSEKLEGIGSENPTEVGSLNSTVSHASALAEPTSLGSEAHQTGKCKPCAFFHNRGCESGADCGFCHLCIPGEKKIRKQVKKKARQMRKSEKREVASDGNTAKEPEIFLSSAVIYGLVLSGDTLNFGSAAHQSGDCKPCAFFHTQSCGSGIECMFCHLCVPGEKKIRKLEKKKEHKMRKTVSNAFQPFSAVVGMPPAVPSYEQPGFFQMPSAMVGMPPAVPFYEQLGLIQMPSFTWGQSSGW